MPVGLAGRCRPEAALPPAEISCLVRDVMRDRLSFRERAFEAEREATA
jgi:hypothetical protein